MELIDFRKEYSDNYEDCKVLLSLLARSGGCTPDIAIRSLYRCCKSAIAFGRELERDVQKSAKHCQNNANNNHLTS